MATNPNDLMGLVASGGPNPFLAAMQGQQGLQAGQQQLQAGRLQLQAAQDQQAQDQQYQADVSNYFKNPKPEILASLIAKYPQKADALKQSKAALDEPARQSQLTQYSQIFNAANAGRADLLMKQAQAIKTAEAAQGVDTSEIDDLIGQLQSSDPATVKAAVNSAKALSQVHIAALDPKFADDIQKLGTGANHFTSTGDSAIYDQRTGEIVRPAPDKPGKVEYRTVKNADGSESIIALGGGGHASGSTGGAPGSTTNAPRRSMGWTPRQRDGGDNPDSVVDAKLAAISKATGIDPDAPLTPQQAAKVIAAIPATEGGAGSIADRNNNPGNIKWGGFARSQGATKDPNSGYAVFPTKEAGLKAAQRLGQGYYARGQRTIRDIIEGKPVGGSAAPPQASGGPQVVYTSKGQSSANNDSLTGSDYLATLPTGRANLIKAIIDGRAPAPRPGSRFGEQLAEDIAHVDPSIDTTTLPMRQQALKDFSGNGKAAQVMASLGRFAAHMNSAWENHLALGGRNLGPLSGIAAGITQSFDPAHVKGYSQELEAIQGEFQKLSKNGAASETEAERLIGNAKPAQSEEGRAAALKAMAKLALAQYPQMINQWHSAFPDRPLPVDLQPGAMAALQNIISGGKAALPVDHNGAPYVPRGREGAGGAPVKISGASDYAKLPSGAHYIDPQGIPRVKK